MFTPNPPPGSGNTVLSNGPYRLQVTPPSGWTVSTALPRGDDGAFIVQQ